MKLLHNIVTTGAYNTVTVSLNDIVIILIIVIITLTIYHDMKFLISPIPRLQHVNLGLPLSLVFKDALKIPKLESHSKIFPLYGRHTLSWTY